MFDLYDEQELSELPTLSQTQGLDLKVDTGDYRVWLDRTGEDTPVQYELRISGRWYDAYPNESGDTLTVDIPV
jgi:hypothetical protein